MSMKDFNLLQLHKIIRFGIWSRPYLCIYCNHIRIFAVFLDKCLLGPNAMHLYHQVVSRYGIISRLDSLEGLSISLLTS